MTDRNQTQTPEADTCGGCAIAGRRQFLRDAGIMVAGALVALGAAPAQAAALELRFIRSIRSAGALKDYPIPATDGVSIDQDESVIIARYQGAIYAFSLACPHQNTALRWELDQQEFRCPKHHSTFTPDGIFIQGRATRDMDRFAVTRDGVNVGVDFDNMYREDEDPDLWKAAFIKV